MITAYLDTSQQFDKFGINISVDGTLYRAIPNPERTQFCASRVRALAIVIGSTLIDERGVHYRVEQCEQSHDGLAHMRVRQIPQHTP